MKRYPKYKDSGVEWIGEVPEQWEVKRLKFLAKNVNEQTNTKKQDEIYIALENVESWTGRISPQDNEITFESQAKCFCSNDILFGKLRPYLAKVARPNKSGVCVGEFLVLRVLDNEVLPEFLEQKLRSQWFIELVNSSTFGAKMPRADWTFISNVKLTYPSPKEQNHIASYLDHKTRLIDTLIEKKQKLVELLQEQRTALISHAVTKGLNPKTKMKDTGIEWLGKVPEHWATASLRWYLRIGSGEFLSNNDFLTEASDQKNIPVIGGNGVMGYTSKTNIQEPTIAIGRVGALCGNVHLVNPPAWITDNALRLSNIKDFLIDYLSLFLGVLDLNRLANQNAQPLITGSMIKSQKVPIPPIPEQKDILQYCSKFSQTIDHGINTLHKQIAVLQEYRTTLISDVVTGKIDVRDEVIP
ncbi:restriction endonuclease subunit S [Desulfosudis oleivorans]|uniref:Restriction modification system DNA specificity domain n=1 Tax=Desulfosudis oleivorans (strain DSM 6200 / JCM 39069 / Hxd3) TaxID=96561 RepID=A8ZS69_DESOH|nr:restriction endonuclease subunit S [Desulfosudis oleivorans]ABW66087.1 restriction modification system DNA specificity domain [Desulfosudis oleivorans Hxd3]